MSAYTPGPWSASAVSSIVGSLVSRGPNDNIASVMPRESRAETEANARLVAAAPELLAALKDVFKMMDEGYLVRDVSNDGDQLWALTALRIVTRLKNMDTAIAKAEGK